MTISGPLRTAFLAAALSAPLLCAAQAYEDWTVQCDNVNHCEAVGYGPDRDTAQWIAVQLVRDAGPATPVTVRIIVAGDGPGEPVDITITVDNSPPVRVRANQPIPKEAAHKLLGRMIDGRAGVLDDGAQQWALPLAGTKAALLRMDALQGRLETPGALVRRGGRPEAAVPAAPAMPALRAAPSADEIHDREIEAALLAELGPSEEGWGGHLGLYRLSNGQILVLLESDRGPTSSYYEAWLANGKPPYQPRRIDLPTNGLASDGLANADFDGQVLGSYSGRTLSDCFHVSKWLWTGSRFELLAMHHADHCRGMLASIDNRKWVARKAPPVSPQHGQKH
ncbi:DUF1176 domain-containing protein [Pseudoduganella umbonata]|uniref:DUF1176 domain-containing protein n=1 Tax=Pseudoduganella umbonata TaxID=864828 RepID=A0A4P8HN81_9BURK|nr:DUF1176 domain-containing protein [Pseudoduganella umbonata]MBB3219809.1 hypothetical protein [Pseudoduganella umbonata]QCP09848.1 DUF1176 domain-containing protein [Pseudoduganella umbonata]